MEKCLPVPRRNAKKGPCPCLLYTSPVDGWINFKRGDDEDGTKRGKYAEPEPNGPCPYFIAYYGVSVKWGKPPVIGAYPEGKDYRAKTWQEKEGKELSFRRRSLPGGRIPEEGSCGCLLYTSRCV